MKPFLYLAPIRGITTALYRNLFCEHFCGVDMAVAPFIYAYTWEKTRKSLIRDILPEHNARMPVVPQIIGNDPEGLLNLAKIFHDLGYETINWNLGCPVFMVAKKMRGSGLLPHPELIKKILDNVIPFLPGRLSIKTRIGRETKREIFDLIPIFNQYPLEEIIIHPRTGIQMYKGNADSDVFEECLSLLNHRLVYNGDIFDLETFNNLKLKFKTIDRWMIGRGVISNPFLPEIIKSGKDNISDKILRLKLFHDELFAEYTAIMRGDSHLMDKMKSYWQYLYLSFENGERIFKKIKKLRTVDAYKDAVDNIFENAMI